MTKSLSNFTPKELQTLAQRLTQSIKNNSIITISETEKSKFQDAILKIKFPYSIKDILVYANKEIADLLAESANPVVQKWGKHCKAFYEKSPCREFVVAETGIVTTSHLDISGRFGFNFNSQGQVWYQGMSARGPDFVGQGVWNLKNNCWIPSPNSVWNSHNLATRTFHVWLTGGVEGALIRPPALPPLLSTTPLELLTPQHIAALLGNMDLMNNLVNQGLSLDTKFNHWEVTPLEMAVSTEQLPVVAFLLQQEITQNLEKAQLAAVKEGSFALIDTFLKHSWLSDAVLKEAQSRDPALFTYLDEMQRSKVDELLAEHTPLATLQTLLKAPLMPTQLLNSFIERYPDVVLNPLPDDPNENTLLNSLVSAKEDKKVSKLLEAMFECCYLDISNYQLDCEKKNKQGKTVLDLALATGIHEITSAILLYGNPKNLSIEQQNKLVETKIDVGGITREREKRALQIAQSDHKTIEKLCISTNVHIKHSLELEQELKQTQFELLQTQNAMVQMSYLVSHLYLKLGIEVPNSTNVPQNPLVLLPSQQLDANLHGFFAPKNQAENNQVQPTMANNQG